LIYDDNCIEIRDYKTSKDCTYAFITPLSIIIKILINVTLSNFSTIRPE
jgi:hypothetical protein